MPWHGMACSTPSACALGIANPVLGERVQMTNHHWSFSISELQHALGLQRLVVIDDFTALAWSLPALTSEDLHRVGGGASVQNAPLAVIGSGTGLGVSGLLPTTPGIYVPIKARAVTPRWLHATTTRPRSSIFFNSSLAMPQLKGPCRVQGWSTGTRRHAVCPAIRCRPSGLLTSPQVRQPEPIQSASPLLTCSAASSEE